MERVYSYSYSWYLTGIAGQLHIPVASDPTSQRTSHISRLGERMGGPKCLSRYSSSEEKGLCLYRETNFCVLTRSSYGTIRTTTEKLTRTWIEYSTLSAESTNFT